jgi:glycosyltransferase involved in cell wall biosynthesis
MWPDAAREWYGIFIARQMRSLPRVGVDVDVIAVSGSADAAASLPAYLRAARRMVGLNFRPRRYDVLHAHTGHCGLLACLQFRYPVLMSYVGYDIDVPSEDREGIRTKTERWIFIQLSRLVAGTIVKSRRAETKLPRSVLGRSQLLPNGIDRDLFKPIDRAEARRQIGWGDAAHPVVLFASDPERFTKRYWLAEAAVAKARERFPDIQLHVCSKVDPALMPVYMSAADVLILSSVGENSPNVVKEAMACDLPVVSVDVGDVSDVVAGTRHCHVCPHEPEPLAEALGSVVDALPERSDGRARSEWLGLTPIAERLSAQYAEVARRGPGPLGFLQRR